MLLESTDKSENLSELGESNNSFALDDDNNPCPSYEPDNSYASDVLSTAFANPNSFMGSDSSGEATPDTKRGCVLGFEDPNSAMGRDSYGDATVDTRRANIRRRRRRRYAPRKRSGTQKKGGSLLPDDCTGTAKRRTTKEPANEDRSKQLLKFSVKRLIDSGTTNGWSGLLFLLDRLQAFGYLSCACVPPASKFCEIDHIGRFLGTMDFSSCLGSLQDNEQVT